MIRLAGACLLTLLVTSCAAQCPCWQAPDGAVICDDPSTTSLSTCVLSNVKSLYLINNLVSISKDTFANCPVVEKLWIQNRELDLVTDDAFSVPGAYLMSLVISSTSLRYLSPQVFYYTPNLQVLDLKNNKISYLPQDAFTYMQRGVEIYLQNNNLMSLTPSSFENTKVQWLYLEGNPWICDCALWNFLQWMSSNGVRMGDNPNCAYPQLLRGVRLSNFSVNVNCYPPSRPPSLARETVVPLPQLTSPVAFKFRAANNKSQPFKKIKVTVLTGSFYF